jgi:hypothetical protein
VAGHRPIIEVHLAVANFDVRYRKSVGLSLVFGLAAADR